MCVCVCVCVSGSQDPPNCILLLLLILNYEINFIITRIGCTCRETCAKRAVAHECAHRRPVGSDPPHGTGYSDTGRAGYELTGAA